MPRPACPGVSVLMPTYEQPEFIARALDSLCAQTYGEWELVIVDASPGGTTARAVQPWLADPRVHYERIAEGAWGARSTRHWRAPGRRSWRTCPAMTCTGPSTWPG